MRPRDSLRRAFCACVLAIFIHSALPGLPGVSSVFAAEARPAAEDPALEKRVTALAEMLRCLVCQNQTIADSHADLAIDLKNQIREKMKAGESDKQIVDYMVARYGEFVLYKPRVEITTVLLWFGPFALLLIGLVALFFKLRARASQAAGESLSAEEHARAAALLAGDAEDKP